MDPLRLTKDLLINEFAPLLFGVLCIKFIQLFQSFVLIKAAYVSMLYGLKLLGICMVTVPAALLIVLLGLFDPYGNHVYGISRLWTRLILADWWRGCESQWPEPSRSETAVCFHGESSEPHRHPHTGSKPPRFSASLDSEKRTTLGSLFRLGDVGGKAYYC